MALPPNTYPEWRSGKVVSLDGDVLGDITDYVDADGKLRTSAGVELTPEGSPVVGTDRSLFLRAAGAYAPGEDDLTAGDVKRQGQQALREMATQGLIGVAGTGAELALSAIPTAADRRNNERLATLDAAEKSGTLGLGAQERQALTAALLNPVRAEATEAQQHADARLASMGNTSAAAQLGVARANDEATRKAALAAGTQIMQADIAAKNRQLQELDERTAYKAERAAQRLNAAGGLVDSLAGTLGRVAAAQATKRDPYDAEIDKARDAIDPVTGMRMFPELQNMDNGQARSFWSKNRDKYVGKPTLPAASVPYSPWAEGG